MILLCQTPTSSQQKLLRSIRILHAYFPNKRHNPQSKVFRLQLQKSKSAKECLPLKGTLLTVNLELAYRSL